ncbi:MAG TPA: L,D-transpeptidase [Devosia sp.]|jgi:lipoprotein-anchoring transpeptidase ErfK/SrfK|nr:L,D-transpeptidase [Devosia sp.]
MSRWIKAAFLAVSFVFASLSPALSASSIFAPPPGITMTNGSPFNFLQLRSSGSKKNRIDPKFMRQVVPLKTDQVVGTIIVDTDDKFLYLVLGKGKALRYGIGTAREGFEWSGTHKVTRKAEWPGWTPPAEMKKRQPGLPDYMPGGPKNPLGARALYLGSTLYRIHGTNEPWTIGGDVSSGCIRMVNDDVIDLYERVKVGAKVIVL